MSTLCSPIDYSLPGSSAHGIFQTRILEWVTISFSRGSSRQWSNPHLLCLLHWQADSLPLFQPRKPSSLWAWANHLIMCEIIIICKMQISFQLSRSVMSDNLRPHESQHARPPCPAPTPRVHSDSCPSSQWCHPAISSSVVPSSSCPQSLPASESFPMSQLFAWGGQSTGVSALASFLPKNPRGWSPSEWTAWISLQSKGLSRVFSNTTVKTHQFLHRIDYLWTWSSPMPWTLMY